MMLTFAFLTDIILGANLNNATVLGQMITSVFWIKSFVCLTGQQVFVVAFYLGNTKDTVLDQPGLSVWLNKLEVW